MDGADAYDWAFGDDGSYAKWVDQELRPRVMRLAESEVHACWTAERVASIFDFWVPRI